MRRPTFPGGSSITTEATSGRTRHRAASLALGATVALTVFKLAVAVLSGSVGVLSEGIHSFLDLVSAALSYFTVREASKPADADHPFGHGKIETLSSLFEALLLIVAAGIITYEGIDHILHPQPVQYQGLAMAAIVVSLLASYVVYRHNSAAARETESSALRVNALHFLSDVVASGAILTGLLVLKLTGWLIIDPIMAFAVAAYILGISAQQVKEAILELSDIQLPDEELARIREVLREFETMPASDTTRIIEAHDLRTRKSGAIRHIDFHLTVCRAMSVQRSHEVCDEIEERIQRSYPRASVNIHVEPCEASITGCSKDCRVFRHSMRQISGASL